MNRFKKAASLLALGLLAGTSLAHAQNLTGAGATFPYPIYSKWFDMYHEKTGVQINYQSIGSGAGIQQVKAGTVDFGASDAALSNAQLKDMPRKVVHFPTVAGAVVLAYNLQDLKEPLKLTPALIVGIYMGKITTWNDKAIAAVNPGVALPAAPILPVHRSDGSGTTNIFVTYLSLVSTQWKELVGAGTAVSWPSGVGGKGNEGVAGQVKNTPGALGYVELAYAVKNKMPVASVKNAAGKFVEPTIASTTAAAAGAAKSMPDDFRVSLTNAPGDDAYPVASFTWLLVYKDQPNEAKGRSLAKFLWWMSHDGQKYADDLLYAPLPGPVVKQIEAKIKQITYQGKPLMAGR